MKIPIPLLVLVLVLALRLAGTKSADFSYYVVAAYALAGRQQTIQALAMSWLLNMLSPGIAPEHAGAAVGRYAVIAGGALSVMLRSRSFDGFLRMSRISLMTLLLGGVLVGHSLAVSPIADVSVLKACSWTVVTLTLFAAWNGLSEEQRAEVVAQIFGGLAAILLLSLPLLGTPLGYMRNGSGFQGVLNHPQGFGPTMALLGAWAGARMLGEPRPAWHLFLLVGASLVLVVLSGARTAGVGMVLGLLAAVMLVPALAHRRFRTVLPGLTSRRVHVAAACAILAGLIAAPAITDQLVAYLDKRGDETTGLVDAFQRSRGELVADMMENINTHLFTGIGFGIASDPDLMIIERDAILGLPTSAAIEKGVLPVAVLEELGVFGAAAVLAWLFMVVRRASRASVTALALVLTTLFLNFGESTFFSPGGLGLLPLILLGWAATHKPKTVGA